MEGCPSSVGGDFSCQYNKLVNLRGCPSEVGGSFYCAHNGLLSLEGSPKEIGLHFFCNDNKLTSLQGVPKYVSGHFYCNDNPIHAIYSLFGSYEKYQASLDYNYLRGTDIVKSRFQEALEEIGKTVPDKIKGYNYI